MSGCVRDDMRGAVERGEAERIDGGAVASKR